MSGGGGRGHGMSMGGGRGGSFGRGDGGGGRIDRGGRGGRHFGFRDGRHHRDGRVGVFIGSGFGYDGYGYDGYYYDDDYSCAWLYRRAVYTGSSYWWRRYRDCAY
jgi:hypothetical protein